MKDFADMNSVWDAWVTPGFEPARACVEARMARESLLVEMTVTAAVK
jgi:enamine deaminase RidA (YjgF/YER057c/UK114 family)